MLTTVSRHQGQAGRRHVYLKTLTGLEIASAGERQVGAAVLSVDKSRAELSGWLEGDEDEEATSSNRAHRAREEVLAR